ncbi:hypothetical protein SteCoe_14737 [Stentor coeruleus]|uniref:Uncharacterized protein n=1 Tax=Stentor coeruleus TaxID=5963 RepID=A0A1R2C5H3_9CILI|nr:hypothetical protein SteCoe_14737 [Stentor coeruleus]
MFEQKNILFNPEPLEKRCNSLSSISSRKSAVFSRQSYKFLNKGMINSPCARKKLPQTSNLLIKVKRSYKRTIDKNSLFHDCSLTPKNDNDVEIMVFSNQKVVVSNQLCNLIMHIYSLFPGCFIYTDPSGDTSHIFRYLFDVKLNPISSISDFISPPTYVVISRHNQITEEFILPKLCDKNQNTHNHRFNYINMYDTILPKHNLNSKNHRSPLYILKSLNSNHKFSKPITPEPYAHESESFIDLSTRKSQYSIGKKIKEGPGGFRKAVLLFEKQRCSPSPLLNNYWDSGRKASFRSSKYHKRL